MMDPDLYDVFRPLYSKHACGPIGHGNHFSIALVSFAMLTDLFLMSSTSMVGRALLLTITGSTRKNIFGIQLIF